MNKSSNKFLLLKNMEPFKNFKNYIMTTAAGAVVPPKESSDNKKIDVKNLNLNNIENQEPPPSLLLSRSSSDEEKKKFNLFGTMKRYV